MPGYVTSVKNQGQCGSCWAFSAAAALEGQWFRKFAKEVDVSAANLNDCTYANSFISDGCQGGWMTDAFEYMYNGVQGSDTYPVRNHIFAERYSINILVYKVLNSMTPT